MKKISALICAVICVLAAVSCDSNNDKPQGDGSGHMYNASLLNNPQSLDPQYANDESSNTVITNLYSGLMRFDGNGNIGCCNAESYDISQDGLVYTFKLCEENYWFFDKNDNDRIDDNEYFPVIADDYVFAFQRLLDPVMQSPYAEDFSCVKGGRAIINGSASAVTAGVKATDDYTLVIELEYPSADFLNLLATNAAVPCNEEFFISTKGRYGLDEESVMSNGAFFVRQWFYDSYGKNNILYMKKNTVNSLEDNKVYPSFLSFTIEKNQTDINARFDNDKIDCITSMNVGSYSKRKYNFTSSQSITLGLVFNPEDEVYSNLNLRKAIASSINREELQEQLSDDVKTAYGIIPPAVTLLGRSYRELTSDKIFDIYSESETSSYFSSAKQELNVESFDTVKILVSTESIDSGYLHLLSQHWQDVLGYYIGVEEVTRDEFEERIKSGDYQIALYPLKGTYNSGVSVLEQFEKSELIKVPEETAGVIKSLRTCGSSTDLINKFSQAEQKILNEFKFIPLFYKNTYLISTAENQDIIYDSFSGAVDFRTAKYYD